MTRAGIWLCLASVAFACVDRVTTDKGDVTGVCADTYRAFLGIPFAASTAGNNRFEPPQPRAAWAPSVWDATVYGAGCYQVHHNPDVPTVQSEDCLNLNVWTPAGAVAGSNLPVSVWVHGGTFVEGGGNVPFYNSSHIVSRGHVIMVTINYRLGALGWLVADKIPGNMGLQDQRAALQWVQRNIYAFGGNPKSVTLQGESAGAMSVGVHMVSPASKGLFHRAIMESNVAGFRYRDLKDAMAFGATFAKQINCSEKNTTCLKFAPMPAILHASNTETIWEFIRANPDHILDGFVQWSPTIVPGGAELPGEPIALMASGAYANDVPLFVGTNTNEGETFIIGSWKGKLYPYQYRIAVLGMFPGDSDKVLKKYSSDCPDDDCTLQLANLLTDFWFRCASRHMAQLLVKHQPNNVWMYRYNHLLSFNPFGHMLPMCDKYVCHAAEIIPLFANTFNWTFNAAEQQMSDYMIGWWTSFISTSDPNTLAQAPIKFPLYSTTVDQNLVINTTLSVEKAPAICQFWDEIGYFH